MFKPQLFIPGQSSIKIDNDLFLDLLKNIEIVPLGKESMIDRIETIRQKASSNKRLLENDEITPKEARSELKLAIHKEYIKLQLEDYIESLPYAPSTIEKR